MHCLKCGIQARDAARFCRHCGAPFEERHERVETPRRVTVVLPRPPAGPIAERVPEGADPDWEQNEQAVILPIGDHGVELPETAEIAAAQTSCQDRPSRNTNPESPQKNTFQPMQTEILQRESEAKPFFTQVLASGLNPQHRKLAAIVPLLLLIVIMLFIFAYIAAK